MGIRIYGTAALILASAILGGCATSRSEVKLSSPPTEAQATSNGRTVVIRSIKDERAFEQAPSNPSTPSLGSGGATQATEAEKARAVARKRNTYGQALGDVLLQEGQTVTGVVREHLTAAFQQAGYRVATSAPAGGPAPLMVDVRILKFWAWMKPGFVALTFNGDIDTVLEVTAPGKPTSIAVHAEESRQLGTDDAWIGILDKTLADYRRQTASKLMGPPF